jgi:ketosteroid isomerase-like protein
MTYSEARAWAERWIDEWNRHDVEAVLAHFADDVEFCSPVAAKITGDPSGIVRGRDALRAYWTTALSGHPDLHFELDDVHLGVDCIAIRYRNEAGRGATEIAVFDTAGQVARGWGLYDAG